jgi:RNA polymerase sigma-70 factor (TIGR02960 family)
MSEAALLEAARGGDEGAFERLVEPYRRELHAHCYRMLGSLHDAEDALQDAMLRVWRGLGAFSERGSLRAWLYKIATNASLDIIGRRRKRVLPLDYAPAADPNEPPGQPVGEQVWLEPYPDEMLEVEDGYAAPDARYEQREAVELAFVAAMQELPARQRAVLILREVLGFSAKEVGETLETSVPSVNSALQRPQDGRRAPAGAEPAADPAGARRRPHARDRRGIHGGDAQGRRQPGRLDVGRGGCCLVDAAAGQLVRGTGGDRGLPQARTALGRLALAPSPSARERRPRRRHLHLGRE